jgi:hypothetical protein
MLSKWISVAPERDMEPMHGFFRRQIGAKREVIALPGLIGRRTWGA